jgi:methylmalonyl-CoA epimerase
MLKRINHVAIVGKSNDEAVSIFNKLFGFEAVETLVVKEQGFKSTMISKDDVSIELIEPLDDEGAIAKFLQKRGGTSLHHVSLQVDDIEKVMQELKAKGIKLIGDKPMQVTKRDRTNFIHPSSTGGILIELIERS